MSYMQSGYGMGVGSVGEYDSVRPPFTWMYNPPPYDFLNNPPMKPPPTLIAPAASMGMGCAGGCGCGGSCGGHGVGALSSIDFSPGSSGLISALSSAFGFSAPAIPNWVLYGVAGYLVVVGGTEIGGGRRRR